MTPTERRRLGFGATALLTAASAIYFARGKRGQGHRFSIAAASCLLGPTLVRNCSWWGPVMKTFPTRRKEVWLTIDDGPDSDETPSVLEILGKFGAKATFFCIGRRVSARPELVREVVGAGHRVQNHTFSHPSFCYWAAAPKYAAAEIRAGSEAIEEASGKRPHLFRAPAGLANPFVHAAAEREGLRMIGWRVAGLDGIIHQPDKVIERILRTVGPGDIILMHENRLPGMSRGQRARTLESVLLGLADLGLKTTIPES